MRRLVLAVFVLFVLSRNSNPLTTKPGHPEEKQSQSAQKPSPADQRGTEQSPLIVKVTTPSKTQAETNQEIKDRKYKAANDGRIVFLTGILALIAFGQLGVYAYQARKLRETVESAKEQGKAMERHVGEAARSATAMEQIANTIKAGNHAILRAYLTVTIGTALFQERRGPGQTDLKFEGRANLLNTGNTPARNVRIRTAADILPIPIPEGFQFPLPDEHEIKDAGVVGAHQTYTIGATVKDFVPDSEVPAIKEGSRKALCIWGLITYEDVFGANHQTKFAQWLTWYPNGTVFGYYLPSQNDAD